MNKQLIQTNNCIEDIIDTYSDMVLRLAFLYLKNLTDAEDITQDVFIKLFKSNKIFNGKEHIKAWLITVTSNTAKDYLKSAWKRKIIPIKNEISIQDNYKESELINEVLKLPIKYRDVIYLYYYKEYSTKEISQILNAKEPTVRTRLKRGRHLLKEKLGGFEYE